MAKLDATVLVFSPHDEELNNLRTALEPVVSKYREANNFNDACFKSQNESVELYILGYTDKTAAVDIYDFYHFARENSQNKMAHIYLWGPEANDKIPLEQDPKIRFFRKGQFKDLLESLDAFASNNSLAFIAQKTREALPFLMRYSIPELAQAFERLLEKPVAITDIWQSSQPSSPPTAIQSIHTRLIEGLCFVESVHSTLEAKNCHEVLGQTLDHVMHLVANEVKIKDSFHTTRSITDSEFIKKEVSEGSWKMIELTHGDSSSLLLRIYIKIRPRQATA